MHLFESAGILSKSDNKIGKNLILGSKSVSIISEIFKHRFKIVFVITSLIISSAASKITL